MLLPIGLWDTPQLVTDLCERQGPGQTTAARSWSRVAPSGKLSVMNLDADISTPVARLQRVADKVEAPALVRPCGSAMSSRIGRPKLGLLTPSIDVPHERTTGAGKREGWPERPSL